MVIQTAWTACPNWMDSAQNSWVLRAPTRDDGADVHALISQCQPLDENSAYCNFLQSSHFANTSIIAEMHERCAGFISAYRKPDEPTTLFIWQVAVHPDSRGEGLAFHMLQTLLKREGLHNVEYVETTITSDNQGSWNLFRKLEREMGGQGDITTFLDEVRHFKGEHDTEYLYRIPLQSPKMDKE